MTKPADKTPKPKAGNIVTVFVGTPPNTWHGVVSWAGGAVVENVDGSDPEAVRSALGPSLFATERVIAIDGVDKVDPGMLADLPEGIRCCGTIASSGAKQTKESRALEKVASVVLCDRAWIKKSIVQCFKNNNIAIEPEARILIETACGEDISRARSIAVICTMAGIDKVGARVARQLLGSVQPEAKLWESCDLLLEGKLGAALESAESVEAVPLIAYIAETLRIVLIVREGGGGELTGIHPYVLKQRGVQARRYNLKQLRDALAGAVDGEHRIRGGGSTMAAVMAEIHHRLQQTTTAGVQPVGQ